MFASPVSLASWRHNPGFLRSLARINDGYSRALRQGKPHIFRCDKYGYRCITEHGSHGYGSTPREAYRQAKGK